MDPVALTRRFRYGGPGVSMRTVQVALGALVAASVGTGCYGTFRMTHAVSGFNRLASESPAVRELVFVAFVIVPVYEVAVASDLLVLNTIELFTGENLLGPPSAVDPTEGKVLAVADGDGLWLVVDGQRARKLVRKGRELAVLEDGAPVARVVERDDGSLVVIDRAGNEHVVPPADVDAAVAAVADGPEALLRAVRSALGPTTATPAGP